MRAICFRFARSLEPHLKVCLIVKIHMICIYLEPYMVMSSLFDVAACCAYILRYNDADL